MDEQRDEALEDDKKSEMSHLIKEFRKKVKKDNQELAIQDIE
jgi:hypothetical protein